jgi:hypothetical protein
MHRKRAARFNVQRSGRGAEAALPVREKHAALPFSPET